MSADPTVNEIEFGRFVVQQHTRRLRVDGKVAKLSVRAFDILTALIANDGRMVSKRELLEIVWPGQVVEESNIHVHVSALRKLLGPDVISTVPGRGYRFVDPSPIERASADPRDAPVARPAAATTALPASTAASVHAPGNLPIAPPTLFGRDDDLTALLDRLQSHRLVTLIGTGGIGKTSLALAAAHAERERWEDGVWFVDLAPVLEPAGVSAAVARALGLDLSARADPSDALLHALRPRSMLIVLDNAEHLHAATAALAAALLAGSTGLALLVTSRQALHLKHEQRFDVPALAIPDLAATADLRSFSAVALFEARAAAADSRFRLSEDNAAAVADICRRVDGVPLAIELAAARVRVLGAAGLHAKLRESLRVLSPGDPRSGPRHETLRATFDWTHDLLAPAESRLLRRLAVFVGGFTLGLAQQVAADPDGEAPGGFGGPSLDPWGVLDALGGLIDKSLVVADGADPPRYRLLEVTRAYALEKLVDANEADRGSERHANAVRRLFTEAEVAKNENVRDVLSMAEFLERLAPEVDNLRAARAWSSRDPSRLSLAVGLAASSSEALRMLGHSTEAMHAMLPLRDAIDSRVAPATAELFWTGLCALATHGRLPSAQTVSVIECAERLYRQLGNARRVHLGLYRKGFALMHLGRYAEAEQAAQAMESLEGSDWPPKAAALRLNLQASVKGVLGRFEESIEAYGRAAQLVEFERGEDDFVLAALGNLCLQLLCTGRYDETLTIARDVMSRNPTPAVGNSTRRALLIALTFLGRLEEATAAGREAMRGWRSDDLLPHMLGVFALLALQQGRTADAVRLDAASQSLVLRMGLANTPIFDRARELLLRALDDAGCSDDELERWRREGGRIDEEELAAICLGERGPGSSANLTAALRSTAGRR
ncbi:MAG: winged helix-turn-helix domain-containing protein [Caldimonas sp.]